MASISRQLRCLPSAAEAVYVVDLGAGVVKVGRTCNPRQRLYQHAIFARKGGATEMRYYVKPVANSRAIESELIGRIRRVGNCVRHRNEYFTGVTFALAYQLCRQVALRGECDAHGRRPVDEER